MDDRCCCFSPSLLFGVDDVFDAVSPLTIGKGFDGELSPGESVVADSAAGLSSDVEHVVEGSGADGCSNMLNQGCWRHSVTVRRSLRTDKNRLLEERSVSNNSKNEKNVYKMHFLNATGLDS